MSGRGAPRNRTRYLTRYRGNRRSPSPQGRATRRIRANRGITSTVTRRITPNPSIRQATAHEECVVCRDEPNFFPRDTPTPACKHRTEVCFDCLKRTIKEAVKAGRFGGDGMLVRCPSVGCNQWMKPSDIMIWADVETFDTWVKLPFSKTVINGLSSRSLQLREIGEAPFEWWPDASSMFEPSMQWCAKAESNP
jgi:hypothetical protein